VPIAKRFNALPKIDKKDLREHSWRGFVPNDLDIDKALESGLVEMVNTSGTTQERVTNIWYQQWWNESEAASWLYNKHTAALPLGNHREAILTSPLNTGVLAQNGFLPMTERMLGRFLYLNEKANPGSWDDKIIRRIIDELSIFQPIVLEANPSYLAKVARFAHQHNLPVFQPPAIIFTYENPGVLTRRQIRQAFSAPLISSYGATEAGYVLMECAEGKLHQVSSSCRIDIEYLRPEYGQPNLGRLLLTTLTNPWRSLIRFDVGDLVEIDTTGACPCGCNDGYIFRQIAGRSANLTYSVNGLPITTAAVEEAIADCSEVAEYQVIQKSGRYDVRIVPAEDIVLSSAQQKHVREQIIEGLYPLYRSKDKIAVHFVDEIQTEPSGKYRRTISDIELATDSLFLKGG
jgi:phenylacetate-coenzyme A ligase PaaK-like adenylate-forming protein